MAPPFQSSVKNRQKFSFCLIDYTLPHLRFFLVVSEVSKAGDFHHWPFF